MKHRVNRYAGLANVTTTNTADAGNNNVNRAPSDAGNNNTTPVDSGALDDGGIHTDAQIMQVLLTVNQGEIDQGNLGVSKGTASSVQTYAQMMIADHTTASQREMALAQTKGITSQANAVSQQLMIRATVAMHLSEAQQI